MFPSMGSAPVIAHTILEGSRDALVHASFIVAEKSFAQMVVISIPRA